jgi:hypothetical protein
MLQHMCNTYKYSLNIFLHGYKSSFQNYCSVICDAIWVQRYWCFFSGCEGSIFWSIHNLLPHYITWRHVPENSNIHSCCHEDLTSHKLLLRVKHSTTIWKSMYMYITTSNHSVLPMFRIHYKNNRQIKSSKRQKKQIYPIELWGIEDPIL